MISDLGYGAYFFFATILLCMGIWSFLFVPETKGVTLEEMDALFMRPMHQVVWAQIRKKPLPIDDSEVERRKGFMTSDGEKDVGVDHTEVASTKQV
jgi:hypothetical protein